MTKEELKKEAEEILNNHCDCELLPECISGIKCRCSDKVQRYRNKITDCGI